MSTPSTGGLLVDHAALTRIATDLRDSIQAIDARLDRLESELAPLQHEWGGQARESYALAKATWDRAIEAMKQVLADTSVAVADSNGAYAHTDRNAAANFEQL